MESNEILNVISKVIADVLGEDSIELTKNSHLFNDTGLDSTSVVDFVIKLEEIFNIEIDETELDVEMFEKVELLVDFIASKISSGVH